MVLKDRAFTEFDFEELAKEAQATVERLGEASTEMKNLSAAIESTVGAFCIGLARAPHHVHRLLDVDSFI